MRLKALMTGVAQVCIKFQCRSFVWTKDELWWISTQFFVMLQSPSQFVFATAACRTAEGEKDNYFTELHKTVIKKSLLDVLVAIRVFPKSGV